MGFPEGNLTGLNGMVVFSTERLHRVLPKSRGSVAVCVYFFIETIAKSTHETINNIPPIGVIIPIDRMPVILMT